MHARPWSLLMTKACLVGVLGLTMVVSTAVVSSALPINHMGRLYCQCRCAGSQGAADIDWEKTLGPCNVNGKACKYSPDGGKTTVAGTLHSCMECKPGSTPTEYLCTPPAGAARIPGGKVPGTLQRR